MASSMVSEQFTTVLPNTDVKLELKKLIIKFLIINLSVIIHQNNQRLYNLMMSLLVVIHLKDAIVNITLDLQILSLKYQCHLF